MNGDCDNSLFQDIILGAECWYWEQPHHKEYLIVKQEQALWNWMIDATKKCYKKLFFTNRKFFSFAITEVNVLGSVYIAQHI